MSFLKLGLTAFGGPAMIAYIKEMSVSHHGWLDEKEFHDGVTLCQSIPGASAMQTAAYVGLKARGVAGALVSFVGFGLPAFLFMLVLSWLYASYNEVPRLVSLFNGLHVVVVAIVAHATYSFGKSTFKNYEESLLSLPAAVFLWVGVSPFIVILGAALIGIVLLRGNGIVVASTAEKGRGKHSVRHFSALLMILLFGLLVVYVLDKELLNLAILMMKIDLFAFGGGFASIPLMLQEIVNVRGWMDSKTLMDGIALGQVTPGPIVITSTFVGYMLYGLPGAIIATIAIFTPSFLMVIAVTPVFDRLKASTYFTGATKGILASFVGLLFFVTVKFSLAVPWDLVRMVLVCTAFGALLRKVDILYVVLIIAVISVFVF
ncbi:MAG TPA: chromate efflux transporter [Thermodesulfovibrionales bacterium]|nr:chromate efflux transporter [Thermodesulfovibrionales bacterium]